MQYFKEMTNNLKYFNMTIDNLNYQCYNSRGYSGEVAMVYDWQELTGMTKGAPYVVERVRLIEKDITIDGCFALPPLASLSAEDQVFVAAFIRCHGSIKQMEQYFGVSYPTIKNRLNRIGEQLGFVEVNPPPSRDDVLAQLERGEITVEQAVERLKP